MGVERGQRRKFEIGGGFFFALFLFPKLGLFWSGCASCEQSGVVVAGRCLHSPFVRNESIHVVAFVCMMGKRYVLR